MVFPFGNPLFSVGEAEGNDEYFLFRVFSAGFVGAPVNGVGGLGSEPRLLAVGGVLTELVDSRECQYASRRGPSLRSNPFILR